MIIWLNMIWLSKYNAHPDKPEMNNEDCKLNICGGCFAPSF
jgi:hypothetical protein